MVNQVPEPHDITKTLKIPGHGNWLQDTGMLQTPKKVIIG